MNAPVEDYGAGYYAASAGEPRDEAKSVEWLQGWDDFQAEQKA